MDKYIGRFGTFAGCAILFDMLGRWMFGTSDLQVMGAVALSLAVTVWCYKPRKPKATKG